MRIPSPIPVFTPEQWSGRPSCMLGGIASSYWEGRTKFSTAEKRVNMHDDLIEAVLHNKIQWKLTPKRFNFPSTAFSSVMSGSVLLRWLPG